MLRMIGFQDAAAAAIGDAERAMARGGAPKEDRGRCARCGGRITATHMLTKSYEVNEEGRWHRRLDDFVEDLVVVCALCGAEPEGRLEVDDGSFALLPQRDHRRNEEDR